MDFIIGVFIFTIVILLFYHFVPNLERQELDSLNDVYFDARTISYTIAGPGYPSNWTNATVRRIGILGEDGTINSSKVSLFYNMTQTGYESTKELFDLSPGTEYVIHFTDRYDNPAGIGTVTHIGSPAVTLNAQGRPDMAGISHEHLVSLTRILAFNQTIVKAVIYAWM